MQNYHFLFVTKMMLRQLGTLANHMRLKSDLCLYSEQTKHQENEGLYFQFTVTLSISKRGAQLCWRQMTVAHLQ